MIKKFLFSLVAIAIIVMLWHGAPIPKPLWRLVAQNRLEEQNMALEADGVYVSVLPSLKLRLLNPRIVVVGVHPFDEQSPDDRPVVTGASLLRMEWSWLNFFKKGPNITAIGAQALVYLDDDGLWFPFAFFQDDDEDKPSRLPFQTLRLEQSQVKLQVRTLKGELQIDELLLDTSGQTNSHLGARWFSTPDTQPLTISGSGLFQQTDEGQGFAWQSKGNQFEIKGPADNYPWYATVGLAEASLSTTKPQQLTGADLKIYVRRDDDPDTHQAAFSVKRGTMQLPQGLFELQDSEWTYTDHDAQSWSFNSTLDLAKGMVSVEPTVIAGSESVAAPKAKWSLNCGEGTKPLSEAWRWEEGWFKKGKLPTAAGKSEKTVLLCH